MDNREAINWLINISADIGKAEHSDLWHYEQALTEIKDMLESAQPKERTDKRTETRACDLIRQQDAVELAMKYCPDDDGTVQCDGDIRELLDELENLPPAQPEQKWIPCSERLPENRVSVIVCFREWQQYAKRYVYSIVVGWYARKHSVHENVFSDWEADCEYDEIEDEYYIEEGWYEFTTQGNGDLMNWYINADVIAWMPLPEPYKEGGADG